MALTSSAAAPTKPAAEIKAPKAVLQQICHKEGRAPPRFEKLPLGGDRLKKAGFRYCASQAFTSPETWFEYLSGCSIQQSCSETTYMDYATIA